VTRVEETESYLIIHIDRRGLSVAALRALPAAASEGA